MTNQDILVPVSASRILELARVRGLSENRLAKKAGIPQTTVNCIANGKVKRCRLSHLGALAAALQCAPGVLQKDRDFSPSYMIWGHGAEPPSKDDEIRLLREEVKRLRAQIATEAHRV